MNKIFVKVPFISDNKGSDGVPLEVEEIIQYGCMDFANVESFKTYLENSEGKLVEDPSCTVVSTYNGALFFVNMPIDEFSKLFFKITKYHLEGK